MLEVVAFLQISHPQPQFGHILIEGIEGAPETDHVFLVSREQRLQKQSQAPTVEEVAVGCLGLGGGGECSNIFEKLNFYHLRIGHALKHLFYIGHAYFFFVSFLEEVNWKKHE